MHFASGCPADELTGLWVLSRKSYEAHRSFSIYDNSAVGKLRREDALLTSDEDEVAVGDRVFVGIAITAAADAMVNARQAKCSHRTTRDRS